MEETVEAPVYLLVIPEGVVGGDAEDVVGAGQEAVEAEVLHLPRPLLSSRPASLERWRPFPRLVLELRP